MRQSVVKIFECKVFRVCEGVYGISNRTATVRYRAQIIRSFFGNCAYCPHAVRFCDLFGNNSFL